MSLQTEDLERESEVSLQTEDLERESGVPGEVDVANSSSIQGGWSRG